MKKLIVLNIAALLLIIAVLLFPEPKTTGYAVKDDVVEGYMMSFDTKSGGGMLGSSPVKSARVFFAENAVDTEKLILLGSRNFSHDADGEGKMCSNRAYTIEEWAYDANWNGVKDKGEPLVFSSTTDADGCLAIILPSEGYSPVAREAAG